MKFEIKSIATIESPFSDLVNMPVQPKGAKEHYATIVFKPEYEEGLRDL
jgi:tRNA (Thr-GGU) A37 N-methylase